MINWLIDQPRRRRCCWGHWGSGRGRGCQTRGRTTDRAWRSLVAITSETAESRVHQGSNLGVPAEHR